MKKLLFCLLILIPFIGFSQCDVDLLGYDPITHQVSVAIINGENCGCNEFTTTDGSTCGPDNNGSVVNNNETINHFVFGLHIYEDFSDGPCSQSNYHPGWTFAYPLNQSTLSAGEGLYTGDTLNVELNTFFDWECLLGAGLEGEQCWEMVVWQINLSQTADIVEDDWPIEWSYCLQPGCYQLWWRWTSNSNLNCELVDLLGYPDCYVDIQLSNGEQIYYWDEEIDGSTTLYFDFCVEPLNVCPIVECPTDLDEGETIEVSFSPTTLQYGDYNLTTSIETPGDGWEFNNTIEQELPFQPFTEISIVYYDAFSPTTQWRIYEVNPETGDVIYPTVASCNWGGPQCWETGGFFAEDDWPIEWSYYHFPTLLTF